MRKLLILFMTAAVMCACLSSCRNTAQSESTGKAAEDTTAVQTTGAESETTGRSGLLPGETVTRETFPDKPDADITLPPGEDGTVPPETFTS